MSITVVLHNIRSTYNVGAILRTAEGLGVDKIAYSGYTPRYDDPDLLPHLREKLNRQIAKSALGAEKLVAQVYLAKEEAEGLEGSEDSEPTRSLDNTSISGDLAPVYTPTAPDSISAQADSGSTHEQIPAPGQSSAQMVLTKWLRCAIMKGYTVIGLENNLSEAELPKQLILGSGSLANGEKAKLDGDLVLILGEEVHGIAPEIRSLVDYFLEIPMLGQKESFNVSVAAGIALWALTFGALTPSQPILRATQS